jgi:hypothetical protein
MDSTEKRPAQQLETGLDMVQVWIVVRYNDSEDIRMGGSPIIGPYT